MTMNEKVREAFRFVITASDNPRYTYMTLSRCKMDCEYYLGNGHRTDRHLYMGNPQDHIELMKSLWSYLEERPEWLTFDQILEYEKQMLNTEG